MCDHPWNFVGGARLRLRLLGPFEVWLGETPLRLKNRKAQALLGCLALGARGGESRARIAGLLWSESEDDRARATLRQTILELRQSLPDGAGFVAQRDMLLLEDVQTDLRAVQEALNAGEILPLLHDVPRLSETLLEGFEDLDAAMRPWLLGLRRGLARQWSRLLEAMLENAADKRAVAATLFHLDPTHEVACRLLMQAAHAAGDTAGALRAYETLWDALGAEHDMEPSAQTQALIAEIKSADAAPALAAPRRIPVRLAIIVPRFPEDGVTRDSLHLLRGFREELIACLTRFRQWYVVDGDTVPEAALASVATRISLNVSGMQTDGSLVLVLTLRDEDTRLVLWSDRCELTLEGWYRVRQRVVSQTALSTLASVATARRAQTAALPDTDLAPHDQWLRGISMLQMFQPKDWKRTEALFLAATRAAPDYSPPWSGLARMDNAQHFAHPGRRRSREIERRAIQRAEWAVELDPADSRAHLSLGWSLALAKRYERARSHVDEAARLNPLDPWSLLGAALLCGYMGDQATARMLADGTMALTGPPFPKHWAYHATIAFLRGDDELAAEYATRIPIPAVWHQGLHAAALHQVGRQREAEEMARQCLAAARANWFGCEEATDEAVGHWLLHIFPIARPADWERLRDGLVGAGIPAGCIRHHGW